MADEEEKPLLTPEEAAIETLQKANAGLQTEVDDLKARLAQEEANARELHEAAASIKRERDAAQQVLSKHHAKVERFLPKLRNQGLGYLWEHA